MRHFTDSHTRRAIASAHAKHAFHCSCGKIVHGNGGRFGHFEMHRRRGDGHHLMTPTAFYAMRNAGDSK